MEIRTIGTRSYKLSPYCESTSDEPSAGNLHAGFCGSRRWVTASGDPVGTRRLVSLPRPPVELSFQGACLLFLCSPFLP
jgi:hypothetical protein